METLGDAWEGGWQVSAVCHGGMIDLGSKSHKKCDWKYDFDMPTLLAAKGRKFPIPLHAARADNAIKNGRCEHGGGLVHDRLVEHEYVRAGLCQDAVPKTVRAIVT